jgi:hypothetical protein
MTAYDWAVVVAVAGLLITAGSYRSRDTRRFQAHQQELRTNQLWRQPPPAIETEPGDPHSDDRIDLELMFIPQQRQTRKDQP